MSTKPKSTNPGIYLDDLDQDFINAVNQEGRIALCDLPKQHPELQEASYRQLWYRARSLCALNLIRVERARKHLVLYALER